jgi:hypothetical protein
MRPGRRPAPVSTLLHTCASSPFVSPFSVDGCDLFDPRQLLELQSSHPLSGQQEEGRIKKSALRTLQ